MTEYYRLSGGGNDFLGLVEPKHTPSSDEIHRWCRRGISVGADGLFVLERIENGARMTYFNADGRAADLCLNGTRCAAQLALTLGWIADSERPFIIETGAGTLEARSAGTSTTSISLPPPPAAKPEAIDANHRTHSGWRIAVGVPHFVLFVDSDLDTLEIDSDGPAIRHHAAFAPAGVNVDWMEIEEGGFAIRTWERGVEAETLACGTGVLAATASAVAAGTLKLPARARTRGGFVFTVDGEVDGETIRSWSITGDARIVARGEVYPGASADPAG